jgi:hypothetical protein
MFYFVLKNGRLGTDLQDLHVQVRGFVVEVFDDFSQEIENQIYAQYCQLS